MRKTKGAPATAFATTHNTSGLTPSALALMFFTAANFATVPSGNASDASPTRTAQGETRVNFNIPRQSLADALAEWSKQSGLQVLLRDTDGADLVAASVNGKFSPAEALEKLLAATGLTYEFINDRTVRIAPARSNAKTSRSRDEAVAVNVAQADQGPQKVEGIPEILVEGSKILNTDIARSNDDPQPYVIFDRARIEHSAAATLDDFFKRRLPMNASSRSATQTPSAFGASSIDLRGLGANQTLILIDGRRMANATFNGQPQQPDLTAIPLSAIERIEVLPTTASGIYGGGATGGVINIILRRDYTGLETKLSYDSALDGAAGRYRADVNTGFSLEDGRTNVMLAMGYSDGDALFTRDRDLFTRGRDAIRRNNFAAYLAPNNPPLGATPNIRSADGSNLTLKDGTPLSSPITFVPVGYPGADSDPGGAGTGLIANAGSYNFGLPPTNQRFGGQTDLIGVAPELHSFLGTVRREFSPRVQAFLEASVTSSTLRYPYSNAQATFTVPAAALTNPFSQNIVVTVPVDTVDEEQIQRNRNNRFVGGVIVKLGSRWTSEIDYTWTQSRWSQLTPTVPPVAAAVANGTLDVLRDTIRYPLDYSAYALPPGQTLDPQLTTLKNITLRASGPLFSLPAGDLILSGFVERSDRRLSGGLIRSQNSPTTVATSLVPPRTQDVDTVYVELRAPLAKALELQVGGRHDEYSTEAPDRLIIPQPSATPIGRVRNSVRSTNPTVALRYQPLKDIALRASWGTGFVAPDVNQLSANLPGTTSGFIDPRRGNSPLPSFQFLTGGNPELRPEESESFSAGLILTPRFIPHLRLSVDYTRIEKTDNIAALDFQQVLDNEAFLPGRITRGPNLPTDPPGWAGPVTFLDRTNANIARSKIEAYDLQLDYRIDTAERGSLELQLMATRLANLESQLVPTAPVVQNAGVVPFSNSASLPLKLKANLGVTWKRERWTAGWLGNYFDSYLVANPALSSSAALFRSQGSRTVRSQMYHDLFASYRFGASFLQGTEVQLTVRNVLNEEPPLDVSNTLGLYSYLGDPRLASYILSVRHAF